MEAGTLPGYFPAGPPLDSGRIPLPRPELLLGALLLS